MNVYRLLMRAIRAYFWIVVGGLVFLGVWALNRYVISVQVGNVGWLAVAGFGAVLGVFLFAIKRMAI